MLDTIARNFPTALIISNAVAGLCGYLLFAVTGNPLSLGLAIANTISLVLVVASEVADD